MPDKGLPEADSSRDMMIGAEYTEKELVAIGKKFEEPEKRPFAQGVERCWFIRSARIPAR